MGNWKTDLTPIPSRKMEESGKVGLILSRYTHPASRYEPIGFAERILIYHHFEELAAASSLTGIFTCDFNEDSTGTTLARVSYTGVRKDLLTGIYSEKKLPELSFAYSQPQLGRSFNNVTRNTLANVPEGFNHPQTRWIDLFGEGIPGILTESAATWYYKQNCGGGEFGKQSTVIQKPSQNLGTYALGDFDNDGNLNLFSLQGRQAGYYEYNRDREQWSGFKPFKSIPQVGHTKLLDIDADGLADLVVECDDRIICYPFKGKEGFEKPFEFAKPRSHRGEYAPTLGDKLSLDYFMADMTGDGLPDQVRITNGQVVYYPNLGNGHFGQGVLMENAPVIDFDNAFDASRIRLYDLDGSGTTDIVYIANGELRCWHNASGNKFIEGVTVRGLPYIDNISSAVILDLLGESTPCLVWSNSLTSFQQNAVQYLELTNGVKPRLLISLKNGMGNEVQIEYGHSSAHYLKAKESDSPWISKIPHHFTVADKKVVLDHITNTRFETQFKYRDGHYDDNERTFVVFGLVEQYDTALFANVSDTQDPTHAQPRYVKTWLHNGVFGWDERRSKQYYQGDSLQPLLLAQFFEQPDALDSEEFAQGYHCLAGKILRQEIYAADFQGIPEDHPYQINQTGYCIRRLQPKGPSSDSCFYGYQTESLSIAYEKNHGDPKISHHLSLLVNNYGDIEKEVSIAYARRSTAPGRLPAQSRDYITAASHRFALTDGLNQYRTGTLYETLDYEINHLAHDINDLVSYRQTQNAFDGLIGGAVSFDQPLSHGGASTARLLSWNRTLFWSSALDAVLPLGQTGSVLLAHHEETACFNDKVITDTYSARVLPSMLSSTEEGHYIPKDGYWWQHTAVSHFDGATGFFSLNRVERQAGQATVYKYDPYFLNVVEITDPLGNVTRGEIDYNNVEPFRLIDPNDNVSEVLYDALGVTVVTSYQGTVLGDGGAVHKYGNGLVKDYTRRNDETFDNILNNPGQFLQETATFSFYDCDAWLREGKPLTTIQLTRENLIHNGKGGTDHSTRLQVELGYQDGFGRIIQSKRKVEDGPAIHRQPDGNVVLDALGVPELAHTSNRWLVTGHLVYNNKVQPVRQFEPFYSSAFAFESDAVLARYGVATQNYYDALGRVHRTDFPNKTFTEVKFSAWDVQSFDQNDTVDRSLYRVFREFQPATSPERMALDRSLAHKDTPESVQLDPLGREIVVIKTNNDGTIRKIENSYDINGNVAEITDARGLKAFQYKRDMLGRQLHEISIDAGEKWSFHNNLDQTIHLWDSRNVHQRTHYDPLGRVLTVHVDGALGLNQITERFVYGEDGSVTSAKEKNLRGALVKHYDQAGIQELLLAFPGGIPSKTERQLLAQFTTEPNWDNPASVALAAERYASEYAYDALGRPVEQKLPDHTTRKYVFNQGGGVQKVLVSTSDGMLNEMEVLKATTYDAKGLRQSALLGNNVELGYTYDTETFRMNRLRARRTSGVARLYQDIHYTYDPVGNLIHCVDEAQQPAAVNPKVLEGLNVSAHSEFTYDAFYQLIEAKGRVHQALLQHDYTDRSRENGLPADWGQGTRHITLNNGASVERYTRSYQYDLAGNIKSIRHQGASQTWNTQIWASATSNRSLPQFDLNGAEISNPESHFDASGNCIVMPHLRSLEWNYRNNISKALVIDRSAQGKPNDEEYYVYGGDGMRVRKITQRVIDVANATIELTEKIYVDGCEIKRITRNGTEVLKRFTSQISDGTNNLALIHAWQTDSQALEIDDVTQKKIHYQLGNHLGSASMELDENGDVITYEEYFPYGGTAFVAGRNRRDVDLKDYRYCEKERDGVTGFYYFGFRYYAHWMGGWLSPDPVGPEDSENLYLYVHNNPINLVDANGLQSSQVQIRMLSSPAGLPDQLREASSSSGYVFFIEGIPVRYDYSLREIVRLAQETGKTIQVYDRSATETFRQFEMDSSDANYEAYRTLMFDIEAGLETEFQGVDFKIQWHEFSTSELPERTDDHATDASGRTADSNGKDNSTDTNNGANLKTNEGSGKGKAGKGEGASSVAGRAQGTGSTNKPGSRGGNATGNGQPGGQVGGSPANGTVDGTQDGREGGTGNQPGSGGQGQGTQQGESNPTGQDQQQNPQQSGQPGQGGDPRTNFLDDITRVAGYFNLEFGGNETGTGEAGGIPGGMDLFGWRPPMWVRRTLQVAYIATTIVTTIIPIGKAALAAKVAIQGALKVGLRATARQLLIRAAALIPSRAAIRGALTRIKGSIGSGLSRLGGLFRKKTIASAGFKGSGEGLLSVSTLTRRQKLIHDALSQQGSILQLPKRGVSMNDLRSIGRVTGDEYSMFTLGGRRTIIRGTGNEVRVSEDIFKNIVSGKYGKWSGHTHPPGYSLTPGPADRPFLQTLGQIRSGIWGDEGFKVFGHLPSDDSLIQSEIARKIWSRLYGS
jgi:RHS repeat-associated protein